MKETFSFQILVLYREFLAYTKEKLKDLGLNFGQMPLILYTGKHPGCSQTDLTKALRLDWGYSQRSIAKLAEAGFMTKEYDEEKSCNRLELTKLGERAFEVCHSVFDSWDQIKLAEVSEKEKAALIEALGEIID